LFWGFQRKRKRGKKTGFLNIELLLFFFFWFLPPSVSFSFFVFFLL
jgi:hypothetical protein